MNKVITLQECADAIIEIMGTLNYRDGTIIFYRQIFKNFISYCNSLNIGEFDEMIAIEYAGKITGNKLTDLATAGEKTQNYKILLRALRLLGEYSRTRTFTSRFSRFHEPVEDNPYWRDIYSGFMNYLHCDCDYRESTIRHKELTIRVMMNILIQKNVNSLNDIYPDIIETIISQFIHEASKSAQHRIGEMKQFFQYCFDNSLSDKNFVYLIPKITVPHETKIPTSWSTEEVRQLLESIDRSSPSGKRDYAILLIAGRLGLRAVDLVNLELSDFDWERKTITVRQKKTRNTITLPLLNDIGWAVIDYIKSARPNTDDRHLFIRLNAPFTGLNSSSSIERIFTSRMREAGLRAKREGKCGIHSLRHTIGSILLEKETPLPVISQILGHRSIQSTETYLRINMAGLNECPIDPEKVFDHEV